MILNGFLKKCDGNVNLYKLITGVNLNKMLQMCCIDREMFTKMSDVTVLTLKCVGKD